MTTTAPIPAHVPPHLVRDFNYADMRGETDVYEHFRKLHEGPEIFWSPHLGGHWVTTRFDDMAHVFSHPEDFSSHYETVPTNPSVIPLLEYDGAQHKEFREMIAPFFSPKSVGDLEKIARSLTIELIDAFIDRGECEFVAEFSKKMPIVILMNLLGLPDDDRPYLMQISEDIVRSCDMETQTSAFMRVTEYIRNKVIPARRANPGADMFSAMLRARIEGGRPMTEDEIVGLGSLFIAAGLDTVASMLGFITKFLAENPAHRQQLIDEPGLINDALEEMMRRFHIANVARMVAHDLEYKGIRFKAGECILTPTSAAGIDERRFKNPFVVDFHRGDKKTLVFGRGPHQCVGAFLARTELRVFLQEWMRRIPHFGIKPGETPIQVPGKANGMRYLPLVWNRRH
jgi:cytochrome P450